jgi:hypothetical protein
VDKLTHPELLVPDPTRSIRGGCFVREAFKYNPDTWDGRMMFSLSKALGFSLDVPWNELPEAARKALLYGIEPAKIPFTSPPDAKVTRDDHEGREIGFNGIARRIERYYRRYRQRVKPTRRWKPGSTKWWSARARLPWRTPPGDPLRSRAGAGNTHWSGSILTAPLVPGTSQAGRPRRRRRRQVLKESAAAQMLLGIG